MTAKRKLGTQTIKETKRLHDLEEKMTAFVNGKCSMPTDEEIRELCKLRSQAKEKK